MTVHHLKTWLAYWDALKSGEKNFEVRRDDRGFQKGDILILEAYATGPGYAVDHNGDRMTLMRRVAWIMTGGQLGIEPGYVVMALDTRLNKDHD